MAATTQIVLPTRTASPFALWHLLSLDAPTVAALWTWLIARSCHVTLPLAAPLSMAVAVWIIYAGDRLLDASNSPARDLEARHYFHHRHRRAFLTGIAIASLALAALLPSINPAALRLYLVEGALLLTWLLILHASPIAHRLPKEIAVGIFFAAAVFIPTIARDPALRPVLLLPAIHFATLCSLNCLFIDAWEHEGPANRHPANPITRGALNHLFALTVAVVAGGAALALALSAQQTPILTASALAGTLLLLLHRNRRTLSSTNLRATADLALLTPLLLLPFLR